MAENELYGGPTKRFFISMLTRDIELEDAILDLIDNCVDGAMRHRNTEILSKTPYFGFWAHLTLSENNFRLVDNCGGIPDDRLDNAFRLGRPQSADDMDLPTIGMYGIGMKRALFKIGREATVETSSKDGVRKITYTKEWMDDNAKDADHRWDLQISTSGPRKTKGVTVNVPSLRKEVKRQFCNEAFNARLMRKIGQHFGYLIMRGFEIKINNTKVGPSTLKLYAFKGRKNALNPFDYESYKDGVRTKVTVGFHWRLPRPEELEDEELAPRSRENAGISVVCNDRVILSNDTTFRTAWGTRSVPKFHNQFLAIGGLMSFFSNDAEKLPVSTTKTGIDMESEIYDHALSQCADGLKVFTAFTNKWKGRVPETAEIFDKAELCDGYFDIDLAKTKGRAIARYGGKRFKPALPLPVRDHNLKRITFTRPKDHVDLVSEHIFAEIRSPSEVGEQCFDRVVEAVLQD